jgi:hypothetical protein
MANANAAPLSLYPAAALPAVATGTDSDVAVFIAPFDCVVTGVTYTPNATITGANTNTRALRLRNKGLTGVGTTVVAELQFDSGVNATGYDEKAITLSVTPANLNLASGDVLALLSDSVGTGLADPGGLLRVSVGRR